MFFFFPADDSDESSNDEAVMALSGEDDSSSDSSSEEEEEEEGQKSAEAAEEEDGGSDSDEDEDEDDSSSSDDSGSDDDDEPDDSLGARADAGWGKKRETFYASDEDEIENSDDEALQVEEAVRLQKEQAEALEEEDFLVDDEEEQVLSSKKGKKKSKKKKKTKKRKGGDDGEDQDVEVELVTKDIANVSKRDKLQRLMTEAPELLGLLEEFKAKSSELQNTIQPVLEKVKAGELPSGKGVDYLEVKYHLLLNYCTNLTFYLYMKAQGKSVKDHPVIKQLLHLRTIMEKLQPIDKKLRYQIEKLLQKKSTVAAATSDGKDPLLCGPDLGDLVAPDEDGEEDQVYRAPRLAATPYQADSKSAAAKEAKEAKRAERLRKSGLLRDLHEEWSENPLAEGVSGATGATGNEDLEKWQRERLRYEEENFTRLQPTKERLKQMKAAKRSMNTAAFSQLTDFGDIELLNDVGEGEAADATIQTALSHHINTIDQQRRSRKKNSQTSVDADFIQDPDELEYKRQRQNDRLKDLYDDGLPLGSGTAGGDVDQEVDHGAMDEAEDDFYRAAKSASKKRKKKRKEAYAATPMMTAGDELTDTSRRASRKILKNRGLTPHRKRENRNPRIAKKRKYEKKMKARSGQIRKMRTGETDAYGGELSGIRSDISRSRKMQ